MERLGKMSTQNINAKDRGVPYAAAMRRIKSSCSDWIRRDGESVKQIEAQCEIEGFVLAVAKVAWPKSSCQ